MQCNKLYFFNVQKNAKQKGFTLIELIMVIVILGILSAFALPKFYDTTRDANIAVINATQGAMHSSMKLVFMQQAIAGEINGLNADTGHAITIDGQYIQTDFGYPRGGSGDFLGNLEGSVAIKAAPLGDVCVEADLCFNSRSASQGYPGLTLPSTTGNLVIGYPKGYTRNDQCFAYYWNPQVVNNNPTTGVVTTGC